MKLYYGERREREEVTLKTISRLTGKSILDLNSEINATTKNKITLGGLEYEIVRPVAKKPNKKKKGVGRGKNTQKFFITKQVKYPSKRSNISLTYKLNGKPCDLNDIKEVVGISPSRFKQTQSLTKYVTINGHDIEIVRVHNKQCLKYIVSKDGEDYKGLFMDEATEKTGLTKHTLAGLINTGYYHKTGWKIRRDDEK